MQVLSCTNCFSANSPNPPQPITPIPNWCSRVVPCSDDAIMAVELVLGIVHV